MQLANTNTASSNSHFLLASDLERRAFVSLRHARLGVETVFIACAVATAIAVQLAAAPDWHPDPGKLALVGALIVAAASGTLGFRPDRSGALTLPAIAAIGARCGAAVGAAALIVHLCAKPIPVPGTFFALAATALWIGALAARACAPTVIALARALTCRYERRVLIVTDQSCEETLGLLRGLAASVRVSSIRALPSDPAPRLAELQRVARELDPAAQDEIWLAISWTAWADIATAMEKLSAVPLPVRLLPDPVALRILRHRRTERGGVPTFELRSPAVPAIGRAAKRLLDIVGAASGMVLLAPLLLAVAVAIRLESPGPVFFRQMRGGRHGRPFRIWKFRTMRVVEDGRHIAQATRGDARVTAIGRWLRTSSIDELPQLLNVLRGEMSLIGPRPHALAHDAQYAALIQDYARRYHVKPGLTGWAQINGARGETAQVTDMIKRVDLDVWYASHWSFWLDLKILAQTISSTRALKSAY